MALSRDWWMAKEAEAVLSRQWDEIESRLVKRFGWANLSKKARRALPAARPLFQVEADLDVLERRRTRILNQLVEAPARTLPDVLGKLRVLSEMVKTLDQPLASALLKAAVADLEGLGG